MQYKKIELLRGGTEMQNVFPEYKSEIILGNGKFQIDPMAYNVIYEGKQIGLTPREFEVLYFLAQKPNWVIPKKIFIILYGVFIIMMIRYHTEQ